MTTQSPKTRNWKTTAVTAVLAAAMTTTALTANACSRWVADTDHGIAIIRTYDWADQLGAYAHVHPVGEERVSSPTPGSSLAGGRNRLTGDRDSPGPIVSGCQTGRFVGAVDGNRTHVISLGS